MKRCRLKRYNFQIKNKMNKENEPLGKHENGNDFIADVMPRFFVDERVGCIAIRDTQHPDFDVEHQGLDSELLDVVKFQMGTLINNEWLVSDEITEQFKNECASLNGA